MLIGALIAALAFAAALLILLTWQMKRAASATDKLLVLTKAEASSKILQAASKVALVDKERALNVVIAERNRLEFTVDTVTEQRDALLKESLKNATPGTVAIAVRNALEQLRMGNTEEASEVEAVPDLPSS